MWISKKKYKAIEKRIADLEVQVQDQRKEFASGMASIKVLGDKLESLARIADF